MTSPYNPSAPKRATNLSINSDLLQRARELDINLSAVLEQSLADRLRTEEAKRWRQENRQAVAAYNELVEEQGLFGDGLRSF